MSMLKKASWDGCKSRSDGLIRWYVLQWYQFGVNWKVTWRIIHFRKSQYKCVCYESTMFGCNFSIVIALRWVYKPLRWTNKTVSFQRIPSSCQLKSHVTSYSLPEKPVQVCMLLKHNVRVKFFDGSCVEMGVEAVSFQNSLITSGAAKKVLFSISSRDNCSCWILKQF